MQAIMTRITGETNINKPMRVLAWCQDKRIPISYDARLSRDDNHDRAARACCEGLTWSGTLLRSALPAGGGYCYTFREVTTDDVVRIEVAPSADRWVIEALKKKVVSINRRKKVSKTSK